MGKDTAIKSCSLPFARFFCCGKKPDNNSFNEKLLDVEMTPKPGASDLQEKVKQHRDRGKMPRWLQHSRASKTNPAVANFIGSNNGKIVLQTVPLNSGEIGEIADEVAAELAGT